MPSGYTHCILAQEFNERSKHGNTNLKFLLQEKIRYFQLGALGPDLAYSQQIKMSDQKKVSDKLHYEFTNQVPLRAFEKIKALPESNIKDELFCFFLGYLSHLVADGVIHPFIRDKVGDYEANATAHRVLEMNLDVILMYEFSMQKNGKHGLEQNFTNMHDQIIDPLKTGFEHVAKMFADIINELHSLSLKTEDIKSWVNDMHTVFEFAENENNQFYSKFPGFKNFLFKDVNSLLADKDKYLILKNHEAKGREKSFLDKDIHFLNDCIPMFYNAFTPKAIQAYEHVFNDGKKLDEKVIPAINLDTGRSLAYDAGNDLDKGVTLWGQA